MPKSNLLERGHDSVGVKGHACEQATLTQVQRHTFLAAWLGEMFDGMDASIFALVLYPAISELIKDRSYSAVGFYGSIILATFMVGYAFGGIIFGAIADRIGRSKTMIISILIYALSTGLCGLSHSWIELAFFRFLVGLGIGGELSVGAVLVSESLPNNFRIRAMGLLTASFAVGYLVAAFLNSSLGAISWRVLFVAGILPALVTLYIRSKVKEPDDFVCLSKYKEILRGRSKDQLTYSEKELLRPSIASLFKPESLSKTLICLTVSSAALVGYWVVLAWIPAWINQITGTLAIHERSTTAIVLNIGGIIATVFSFFLLNRVGRKGTLSVAFLGAIITSLTMFLTIKTFCLALLLYAFLLGGFATLPFVVLLIHLPELYSTGIRSTAVGFLYNSGRIIAGIGALISGQLIGAFGGSYSKASACVAICYLIGFCASWFLPKSSGKLETESIPEQEKVKLLA